MITTVKIFPSIGVARLGNSTSGYFIGPERPNDTTPPTGGYRDATGLKRQAARFRLFGFDENNNLARELTSADGTIEWTVHVANTKAASEKFHPKSNAHPGRRNDAFQDRNQLKLDPGAVKISGAANPTFADLAASLAANRAKNIQIDQQFLDQPVKFVLGTLTTDDLGRLIALGGKGESKSPIGADLSNGNGNDFADHDGWYDDVSDGQVSATIKLADNSTPPVASAWLIVAPPKYAPGLQSIVSLYDTLLQSAVDHNLMPDPTAPATYKPSFALDIQPILTRALNIHWVYNNNANVFNPTSQFHRSLTNPTTALFNRLSVPSATPGNPGTGGGNMPKMWSDLYPSGPNGTLTRIQYHKMELWKNGTVDNSAAPPDTGAVTPDGLTRAALEPCVGAAFFPGIEAR